MRVTRREMIHMLAAAAAAEGLEFNGSIATAEQLSSEQQTADPDWRNIVHGSEIPRENYSDQPYVVITKDGNWLCVLTTGNGNEGAPQQHIIATISSDKGKTWSTPVDIEPSTGPEASWVMPLAVPGGRVYVFYTYNSENLRTDTKSNSPVYAKRVDTLGQLRDEVFRRLWTNVVGRPLLHSDASRCASTGKTPTQESFYISGVWANPSSPATEPCSALPRWANGAIRAAW